MNDWKIVKEETKFDTALSGRIYTKPNESYCSLTGEKDDISTASTTYRNVNELATKLIRNCLQGIRMYGNCHMAISLLMKTEM